MKHRPDAEVIAEILEKMGLASSELSAQEKLDAMCLMFKQTLSENVK